MPATEKTREIRLRRAAKRQGLELQRSRARDPKALTFGTYQLIDAFTGEVVASSGRMGFGLSMDDVERALS